MNEDVQEVHEVSNMRKAGAFILDFFTAFFVFGYIVASITGNTSGGLDMTGTPATISVALVIGYFIAGKYLGGTLWQRVIKIK